MLYRQLYETLRRELKQMRLQAGLTQGQLASRLGKLQSYVSKIERGERYIDLVEFLAWCQACGISADEAIRRLEL
ncbi:transcriptional regulator [Bordetella hinzii]|nr:helix-turn-helix transcriptional regulator [Bordetella hinzii]QDJ38366.1 transcriptional regulator [Bordetella hinzii]